MPWDRTPAMSMVKQRLPPSSSWPILGTQVEWTFEGLGKPIDSEVFGLDDAAIAALQPFLIFGEVTYDGGASPLIGLHESDGTVHGIDVELAADRVFWFNNSLDAFIDTFDLLDSVLRSPGALVPTGLRGEAARLDSVRFENSEWAGLLNALIK